MTHTIHSPRTPALVLAAVFCLGASLAPSAGHAQDEDEASEDAPGRGRRPARPARTRGADGPPENIGRARADDVREDGVRSADDDGRSRGRGEDVRERARQGQVRGDVRSPRGAEKAAAASGRSRRAAAWARLRRRAGVDRPSDIPPPMRAELRNHARRTARLSRVIQVALEAGDSDAVARAQALQEREDARHERRMAALAGDRTDREGDEHGDEDDDEDVDETTDEIGGGRDHGGGRPGSAGASEEETR